MSAVFFFTATLLYLLIFMQDFLSKKNSNPVNVKK